MYYEMKRETIYNMLAIKYKNSCKENRKARTWGEDRDQERERSKDPDRDNLDKEIYYPW